MSQTMFWSRPLCGPSMKTQAREGEHLREPHPTERSGIARTLAVPKNAEDSVGKEKWVKCSLPR